VGKSAQGVGVTDVDHDRGGDTGDTSDYVLIPRNFPNSRVWSFGTIAIVLWLAILLRSLDKDTWLSGHPGGVKRGQVMTPVRSLAEECQCSDVTVRRYLKVFVKLGLIKVQNVRNLYTIVTICDYEKYRG